MKKDKHLGLHLSKELHYKLHYISKYEGHSAHGHALSLLRQSLKQYSPTQPTCEKKEKHFSIYLDEETLETFRSFCRDQYRSSNSQIIYTIEKAIEAFEEEHGIIDVEDTIDEI